MAIDRYMIARAVLEGKPLTLYVGEQLMNNKPDMHLLREVDPETYVPEEDELLISNLGIEGITTYAITTDEARDIIREKEADGTYAKSGLVDG